MDVPDILRSDNGPQYASAAFTDFVEEWRFQHTTSSPHYPASNGFAESMVKIIKTAFSGKNPQLTLLALCSTPVDSYLPSAVQLLYLWQLKTRMSTQPSNTDPQGDEHHEHLEDKADPAKILPLRQTPLMFPTRIKPRCMHHRHDTCYMHQLLHPTSQ